MSVCAFFFKKNKTIASGSLGPPVILSVNIIIILIHFQTNCGQQNLTSKNETVVSKVKRIFYTHHHYYQPDTAICRPGEKFYLSFFNFL